MPHSTRLLSRTALALCLAFPVIVAEAAGCSIRSPDHTVALVELFTSEGCSSCPPADRWLGELSRRFTAEQLVALSLHVDYWDYIGWKDRFAQVQFSERQRWLSQLASGSTIYTPEVFTGMKEFRAWSSQSTFAARVQAINRQPAKARINVLMRASGPSATTIEASFALNETGRIGQATQGVVVLYEKRLSSDVRAGENKDALLQHDNVVRYWSAPVQLDAQTGRAEWRETVALPANWKHENLGVAALVQDTKAGELLQVVAMPGCV